MTEEAPPLINLDLDDIRQAQGDTLEVDGGPADVIRDRAPWTASKDRRDKAPQAYKPRPHYRYGTPYPEAPEVFQSMEFRHPNYPTKGIYTTGEGREATHEAVTIVGNPGIAADGKTYIRTQEYGLLPAEQVMESLDRDKGWKISKAARQVAAEAEYVPRVKGRRDEMPYPTAPHAFEATPNVEAPEYPYGAIFTTGKGDKLNEEQVTVIGDLGVMADGKSYVRTKEHGIVPAEQVKTLESELGIDITRFVLAGIGPALYWKKVNVMARDSGESPGVFRRMLSRFTESHPGIKAVGEAVATIKEKFDEEYPKLSGILSGSGSALKSVGSLLAKDPQNSGMYNFKGAAERDMQSGRAFYMARPNNLSIWFKSHNYNGTINPVRKAELQKMREDGWKLQSEISTRSIWGSIRHPNSLYRHELNEFLASTPGSLGYRAVKFANIQRIANLQQRDRTHGQWAVSLVNGRNLTQREREDFWRYVHDPEEYITTGVSPQPQPLSFEAESSDRLALAA